MGRFSKSKKTLEIESLDELDVNPSPKAKITKSQSISEGLSRKSEKEASKENKGNAGEISNKPKQDDVDSANDDDQSPKKPRGTVLNGLARRATIMRQKSLENIVQASKRLTLMPTKSSKTKPQELRPVQTVITDLPIQLLMDILFRTVFWTTLEFEYERHIELMRTLSVVCKKFFEACHSKPLFWNRIWHEMTKSSDREKSTIDVGDAKSLKKECLKLIFYKNPYRKSSVYTGRHFGNSQIKLTMCSCEVGLGEFNLVMQLCRNIFIETWDPRIEDTYLKAVKVDGDTNTLEMLVICHQEEFRSLRNTWVQPADGLVLVYGCDKRSSFIALEEEWVNLAAQAKGVDASLIPKILVCNKIDVPIEDRQNERQVTRAEGLALAQKLNCPYVETSAKKRINIEELFEDIVREIRYARVKQIQSQVQESCEPLAEGPVDLP